MNESLQANESDAKPEEDARQHQLLVDVSRVQFLRILCDEAEEVLSRTDLPEDVRERLRGRVDRSLEALRGIRTDSARARLLAEGIKYAGALFAADLAGIPQEIPIEQFSERELDRARSAGIPLDDLPRRAAATRRRITEATAVQQVIAYVERWDDQLPGMLQQLQDRDAKEQRAPTQLVEAISAVPFEPYEKKELRRNAAIQRVLEALGLPASERVIKGRMQE